MLEKPEIPDSAIAACMHTNYGLQVTGVDFLPLGADASTAVYHLTTRGAGDYFLKLRRGAFEKASVLLPHFLHQQGIEQIVPPLPTKDRALWAQLKEYTCILYPFIEGRSGFEIKLTGAQWRLFGDSLRRVHSVVLPPELRSLIATESFTSHWREQLTHFQEMVVHQIFDNPAASRLAAFMREHREEIGHLVKRASQLAASLRSQPPQPVLCHTDIHAGNLLLTPRGDLYIVDWDQPLLAPRERDLMFIGAGIGDTWNTPREERLFYQGYGPAEVDLTALTYYRFERIVQDLAEFCKEILLGTVGPADQEQGLRFFTSQFAPGSVIDLALQTDERLKKFSSTGAA